MNMETLKSLLNASKVLEEKGEVEILFPDHIFEESFSFAEILQIRDKFFPNISLDKISVSVKTDSEFDPEWSEYYYFTSVSLRLVK